MQKEIKEMFEVICGKAKGSVAYECMEAGECDTCEYKDSCEAYDDEDFELPDFLIDATNIYRTKHFIVKQQLIFNNCGMCGTHTVSNDTYYARTEERDLAFDALFEDSVFPEGKRLPTMSYMRSYKY